MSLTAIPLVANSTLDPTGRIVRPVEPGADTGPEHVDGHSRLLTLLRTRRVRIVIGLLVVALLAAEAVVLTPHLSGAGTALVHANRLLVVLAVCAEAASFIAFAAMHRQMLRGGGLHVQLRWLAPVVLAGNALSATLPAGSAVASGYGFTQLRRFGASVPLAAWSVVITGLISGATLAALGLAATLLVGAGSTGSAAALAAVFATVGLALGLRAATQHQQLMIRLGHRLIRVINRVLRRDRSSGADRVEAFVRQLGVIRPGIWDWLAAVGFAALNWAADVTCLVLSLHAAGVTDLSPRTVLIAYAADAAAGALQVVPGGIGIVDGALILALVNGGVPIDMATAGVLVYRLISLVMAATVGWAAWFVLRSRARGVAPMAANSN